MSDLEEEWKKHMAPAIAEGYTLDPPEYRRLNNWTFVLWQLLFTKVEIQGLIDTKPALYDQANFYGLYSRFSAMIVTYARCFASGGDGIVRLNAKDAFRGEPDLKKRHDRMIDIRNGVVAHTGAHELARATIGVKEDAGAIVVKHMFTPAMPHNEYPQFLEVVEHAERYTIGQVNKHINFLEKKLGKTILVAQLSK